MGRKQSSTEPAQRTEHLDVNRTSDSDIRFSSLFTRFISASLAHHRYDNQAALKFWHSSLICSSCLGRPGSDPFWPCGSCLSCSPALWVRWRLQVGAPWTAWRWPTDDRWVHQNQNSGFCCSTSCFIHVKFLLFYGFNPHGSVSVVLFGPLKVLDGF